MQFHALLEQSTVYIVLLTMEFITDWARQLFKRYCILRREMNAVRGDNILYLITSDNNNIVGVI